MIRKGKKMYQIPLLTYPEYGLLFSEQLGIFICITYISKEN